jgi:hypothetical protein
MSSMNGLTGVKRLSLKEIGHSRQQAFRLFYRCELNQCLTLMHVVRR